MEKLTTYLQGRKQREFAQAVGISDAFLSQILSQKRRPSYRVMLKIEQVTEGAVDIHSWNPAEADE